MRIASARFWIRASAALAAALVAGLAPALAGADPPVWRVHGRGGAEIVMFGSVHLLTPGLGWRTPAVRDALATAQSLWLEAPLDPAAAEIARRTAQANSRLPAGQTLSGLLSKTGKARLGKVARGLGLDPAQLEGFRPWFAELTLTLVQVQSLGADQDDGVEQSLLRDAPPSLPRRWFETPEEQVRYLSDAPIREQVASLEESLKEMEEDPDSFAELQRAWLAGDTAWIVREAIDPLRKEAPGVYERVVAARNRRWADRIEGLLKSRERAFIVVGVGHLVGPDSVPALLRRRGVAVEGP